MEPSKSSLFEVLKDRPSTSSTEARTKDTAETPLTKKQIKERFQLSAGKAIEALDKAMVKADWPDVIKAATAILDRAGYGPKSTIAIEELPEDLSSLTDEQLAERAERVAKMLRKEAATSVH